MPNAVRREDFVYEKTVNNLWSEGKFWWIDDFRYLFNSPSLGSWGLCTILLNLGYTMIALTNSIDEVMLCLFQTEILKSTFPQILEPWDGMKNVWLT